MESILTKNQKLNYSKQVIIDGKQAIIEVQIRYDDQCGNGHNSFAITGSIFEQQRIPYETTRKLKDGKTVWNTCGGCIHDDIKKHFPELKKYIKWHSMNSDGPSHYIANTLYHAKKVKKYDYFVWFQDKQFDFKKLVFLTQNKSKIKQFIDKYKKLGKIIVKVKPNSMNKESNLDYARSTAIWPDAELKDFTEQNLKNRLPQLIEDFKKDLKELNLIY